MRTTIDKAGRLVIPRELRAAVGLDRGGSVEVQLEGGGIRIAPVVGKDLSEEDGLLVIPASGKTIDSATVGTLIDADRHRP